MTLHRGRIARDPTILSVRALTRDDHMVLRQAADGGEARVSHNTIAKLRDPHHRLARLVAAGLRPIEIVARSGYSMQRYMTIKNDPAFIELVATYRAKVDEAFVREADTYYELATANMVMAERMLSEKLEEHDENGTLPPVRELIAISRDAADRFGYGKKQTNLNINADFAAMLEAARRRSSGAVKTIEAVAVPLAAPHSPEESSVPAVMAPPVSPAFRRRA